MSSTLRHSLEKYLESRTDCAARTLKQYHDVLVRHFSSILDKEIASITADDFDALTADLLVKSKSRATQGGRGNLWLSLNILNAVWRWSIKQGILEDYPFPGIHIIRDLRYLRQAERAAKAEVPNE